MIRRAEETDLHTLGRLACLLWPHNTADELAEEFAKSVAQGGCFLCYVNGKAVGFAQCQLRHDYVEGTDSSPVGYLEGIFVREEYRRRGYARKLLAACEDWAWAQGCTEFASDCELSNQESYRFHMHAGFTEANRIICFTKKLGE